MNPFSGDQELAHELSVALAAAREAAETARAMQAGISSSAKADGSPVTPGDLAADAIIRHHLASQFPDDGILSEELADAPERLGKRRVWIIDPIDGTKEYVVGGDSWAVQIGLAIDGVIRLGVLDMPGLGVCLSGIPGAGAWRRDGQGISPLVPKVPVANVLISSASERNAKALTALRNTLPEFSAITATSVGVKVLHLLQGDADLYVHSRQIHEWDSAAPAAVLQAAGGFATALDGQPLVFNSPRGRSAGLLFSVRPDHTALAARLAAAGIVSPP